MACGPAASGSPSPGSWSGMHNLGPYRRPTATISRSPSDQHARESVIRSAAKHLTAFPQQSCEAGSYDLRLPEETSRFRRTVCPRSQNSGVAGSPRCCLKRACERSPQPGPEARSPASARARPCAAQDGRGGRSARRAGSGSGRRDLLPGRRHSPEPGERERRNTRPRIPRERRATTTPPATPGPHSPTSGQLPATSACCAGDGCGRGPKDSVSVFQGRFPVEDVAKTTRESRTCGGETAPWMDRAGSR